MISQAAAALLLLSLPAKAVEFEAISFEGRKYTVARVDLHREKLELFHGDENGTPFKRFAVLDAWLQTRGRRLIFGMNAGMYHANFAPVGLFVSSRKTISPLNLEAGEGNFFLKPNGVFAITSPGAEILESSQTLKLGQIDLATQSGPMLVIDGQIHPAFRAESESRLFRNGVGVVSPAVVVFAISEEPVNFHAFARLFRDRLGCRNALFLDGTVSSLHATALKRSDFRMDLGPIIGVTEPFDSSEPSKQPRSDGVETRPQR